MLRMGLAKVPAIVINRQMCFRELITMCSRFFLIPLTAAICLVFPVLASQWETSPGNAAAHRHFPGTQFNVDTVSGLSMLWRFDSGDGVKFDTVQATPVFTGQFLVTVTARGDVVALEPATGDVVWRRSFATPVGRRGITAHTDQSGAKLLFVPAKDGIHKLDANTGKSLGLMTSGLSLLQPVVMNGQVFVATLKEGLKAFDIQTGDQIWHRPLEKNNKKTRIWSGFSADTESRLLFVTTSNPGGLVSRNTNVEDYSVSLLAIDAKDGSVRWQYQHIENDIWDLDLVSNPIIIHDLEVQPTGSKEDVVLGLAKSGDVLVLRLSDGKPIFPEAIKKWPTAAASGHQNLQGPMQNRVFWPKPVTTTVVDLDADFDRHADDAAAYVRTKLRHAKSGWMLPTSLDYDVVMYGLHGGPQWPGASVHTNKDGVHLTVPWSRDPWILRIQYRDIYFDEFQDSLEPFDNALSAITGAGSWIRHCWYRPLSCEDSKKDELNGSFTRWSAKNWKGSEQNGALTGLFYPMFSRAISHKTYRDHCASCHGVGRQGAYQSEFFGDGYIPSLIGFTLTDKWRAADSLSKLQATHDVFDIELPVSKAQYSEMMAYFDARDRAALSKQRLRPQGFWQLVLDRDGLPATNPPWGNITSLNLNSGSHTWTRPFGVRQSGNHKQAHVGDINFGGLLTTGGGVGFASGTPDNFFRAFDLATGETVWKHQLPYAGSAPPMAFSFKGCDILVLNATGGRFVGFKGTGDATMAFKADDCHLRQ